MSWYCRLTSDSQSSCLGFAGSRASFTDGEKKKRKMHVLFLDECNSFWGPPHTGAFSFLSSFFLCPHSLDLWREWAAAEVVIFFNFAHFNVFLVEINKLINMFSLLFWPNSETKNTNLHHYYKSQKSIHPISK